MNISTSVFVSSSPTVSHCPRTELPEFAFIGRSNVGKSSLINMIAGNKSLAKVSGTPGKTRLINHFLINGSWFIVDLPGYGFAKTSKEEIRKINSIIENYFLKRENLLMTFLMIDSRHLPQKADLEFMAWLNRNQVPFVILFTKVDKLSKTLLSANPKSYRQALSQFLRPEPHFILTSSPAKKGRNELLDMIDELIKLNEASDLS